MFNLRYFVFVNAISSSTARFFDGEPEGFRVEQKIK